MRPTWGRKGGYARTDVKTVVEAMRLSRLIRDAAYDARGRRARVAMRRRAGESESK